jgi:hypothetical protein
VGSAWLAGEVAVPLRPGARGTAVAQRLGVNKKERLAAERPAEQEQGLDPKRRGTPAAPSDMPENDLPHPQDVNEISQRNRKG